MIVWRLVCKVIGHDWVEIPVVDPERGQVGVVRGCKRCGR